MTLELLKHLSRELRELDIGEQVGRVHASDIDTATFLREYVAANKPVIITGLIDDWPAIELWSHSYLATAAGDAEVTVDVTPNGRGDAVTDYENEDGRCHQCFCMPEERRMSLGAFLELFASSQSTQSTEVPYLQHQNSNLTVELPVLMQDIGASLADFAKAAFGAEPDATNVWIGDDRSVTSFHKDHYENLYAVIRGHKVFHLLPPSDCYRLGLQVYPSARYSSITGTLKPLLLAPSQQVLWCPIDPSDTSPAAKERYPLFFDDSLPPPLVASVGAGEVLYLPAMWHHHVQQISEQQEGWVVAVNYWYDMCYDTKYAHYKLTEALAVQVGLMPDVAALEARPQQEDCRQLQGVLSHELDGGCKCTG